MMAFHSHRDGGRALTEPLRIDDAVQLEPGDGKQTGYQRRDQRLLVVVDSGKSCLQRVAP